MNWLYFGGLIDSTKWTIQRPHHIAKALQEFGDQVLGFNEPRSLAGVIFDFVKGKKLPLPKKAQIQNVTIGDGKTIIPTFFPKGLYPLPQKFLPSKIISMYKKAFLRQLVPFLDSNVNKFDFIWVSGVQNPEVIDFLFNLFPKAKKIYDLIDDFPGLNKSGLIRESFNNFDGVVSINKNLLEKYKRWVKPPSLIIPNGVSFPEKPGFALKKRKIQKITYFGVFDFWFDWNLLETIISFLPEIQFYLAGIVGASFQKKMHRLLLHPNVFFEGHVPFSEIPSLLREADLLLITWKECDMAKFADPLKIKEALYAGIPVIYSFPTGDKIIDEKIIISCEPEEIVSIIRNHKIPGIEERSKWAEEIAKNYSWEVLTRRFRDFVISL